MPGPSKKEIEKYNFEQVLRAYGIKAEVGTRVAYTGGGTRREGTITGCDGARFMIKLDGDKSSNVYHPTWELEVLEKEAVNGNHAIA